MARTMIKSGIPLSGARHLILGPLVFAAATGALAAFLVGICPTHVHGADIKMKLQEREAPGSTKLAATPAKYSEVSRVPVPMEQVRGIATDPEDRIYVCGDMSIQIMDKNGRPLSRIPLEEPPRCMACGRDGLIYIGMQEHVEVYDTKGLRREVWSGLGEEAIITSVAAAGEDVYIADAGNEMVMHFDRGGRLLGYIGKKSESREECEEGDCFVVPSHFFDVAAGNNGTIWVVNFGKHRLENYTGGGKFKHSWGFFSENLEGFSGCCNPTHFAITSNGSFVTSEKGITRVKLYKPDGTFDRIIADPDQFEKGTVGLDLAVDSRDRILVLDPTKRSVRIFQEVRVTVDE